MQGFLAEMWMTFQILVATFIILVFAFNFNQSWRRFPWDYTLDKFGFRIYFPIITSLGIAVIMTMLLRILSFGPKSFTF